MRLKVELELPVAAARLLDLGAILAAAATGDGHWEDGGQPVDRDRMLELAEKIDASEQPASPETTVSPASGSIDWGHLTFAGEVHDRDFRLRVEGRLTQIESTVGVASTQIAVRLRVRPTNLLLRPVIAVAAPFIRRFIRRQIDAGRDEMVEQLGALTLQPIVLPRFTDHWTFHRDPHAPRSHVLRSADGSFRRSSDGDA